MAATGASAHHTGDGRTRRRQVIDDIAHRRRASDLAQERAIRAAERGDHAAYVMATRQAEEALRRRAEWLLAKGAGGSQAS
jgi:hypothetical protein